MLTSRVWNGKGVSPFKVNVDCLPDGKKGDYEVSHFLIKRNDPFFCAIETPSGRYVRLTHKGSVVMSDTFMERRTNSVFCDTAHGDVLVGGLGIGLVLMDIQDSPAVDSITVVEKSQDVIDLIAPHLPLNGKVNIICGDVWSFDPGEDRYDVVYMDIWEFINSDVYEDEMLPLKERYRHFLKASNEAYVACWAEEEAENNERLF